MTAIPVSPLLCLHHGSLEKRRRCSSRNVSSSKLCGWGSRLHARTQGSQINVVSSTAGNTTLVITGGIAVLSQSFFFFPLPPSRKECPCLLQGSWTIWPFRVPSNSNYSTILWIELFWLWKWELATRHGLVACGSKANERMVGLDDLVGAFQPWDSMILWIPPYSPSLERSGRHTFNGEKLHSMTSVIASGQVKQEIR